MLSVRFLVFAFVAAFVRDSFQDGASCCLGYPIDLACSTYGRTCGMVQLMFSMFPISLVILLNLIPTELAVTVSSLQGSSLRGCIHLGEGRSSNTIPARATVPVAANTDLQQRTCGKAVFPKPGVQNETDDQGSP